MQDFVVPGIARRLIAMIYEALLLFAILFLAGFLYLAVTGGRIDLAPRLLFQTYLAAIVGWYFVFCWCRGGQTLPMKTWKIRLVTRDGRPLSIGRAAIRYLLALATLGVSAVAAAALARHSTAALAWIAMLPGLTAVGWAAFDRDGQFLYDRLAGTRIVRSGDRQAPSSSPFHPPHHQTGG